ncbi:MAG: feruloyl-CoA synthase [Pusillimonas sp.]
MTRHIPEAIQAIEPLRPDAPFRNVNFAPVDIRLETRADGTLLLSNAHPLNALPVQHIGEYLRRHAANRPDQTFLAQMSTDGNWDRLSYAQALAKVNALSQWLLDQNLPAGHPLLILSENSINQALLQFAAMQIGVPVMPVSPAYSLMSEACGKIADLSQRFEPGLVYASSGKRFAKAMTVAREHTPNAIWLCDTDAPAGAFTLDQVLQTPPTPAVDDAFAKVNLDTIARLLLTSGSTGSPKAVIMTQRNIVASGVLWDQVWPFLSEEPLVMVDWLPWNHTAGAHGALSLVLRHGGTLYLDDGKPVPQLIGRTVNNLRAIKPNIMTNVPRGLDMLVAAMEDDPDIANDIFPNLQIIVYGGASLSPNTLLKLEQFSAQATGRRIPVSSSLGSTETTMPATLIWWNPKVLGTLGLPAPGVEAKLVPLDDRYEIRFRGANITRGYFNDPAANQKSYDDEGFLLTGDAVTFVDTDHPEDGLMYAGRLSENFKLATGTWVSVATVRGNLLPQLHPFVTDAVLTGHDRDELGALFFLNTTQIRKKFPELAEASDADIARHGPLLDVIRQGIERHNVNFPGSSTRIIRAMLLDSPPNIDDNEITDKGYINQSGVLKKRADDVKRLYDCTASADDCLIIT